VLDRLPNDLQTAHKGPLQGLIAEELRLSQPLTGPPILTGAVCEV